MKVVVLTEERDIARNLLDGLPAAEWVRQPGEAMLDADVAILFSTAMSRDWCARFREHGTLVIDHSAAARMDPAIPNVVPHVNGRALADHAGIVASPNCASVILATVLGPIHAAFTIRHAVVVTLQAISGAGDQAADAWNQDPVLDLEARIPQGCSPREDGWTAEEHETREELRRILGEPPVRVSATCVRVPVRNAHGIAVHLTTERPPDDVGDVLREAPLVRLGNDLPTPLAVSGSDEVHVGRLRTDPDTGGLGLWVVGDNLRRGTSLNAIDILRGLYPAAGIRPS